MTMTDAQTHTPNWTPTPADPPRSLDPTNVVTSSDALHRGAGPATPPSPAGAVELTVVMPCLNEVLTLPTCIRKAQECMQRLGVVGEVVVADNGSTDGSQETATALGARVVPVTEKGYGAALAGGIRAARGRYVIMGDSDDSYDFSKLDLFVERLREGYDLVMGNRFKGGIAPGAMPPMHQYFGNPVLSFIARLFFRTRCGDAYCGLRGFSRDAFDRMNLKSTGMEFALEMLVKSTMFGLRVTEVPTTLSPDGRDRAPHLRRWRDGWRSLRFYLLHSPKWLFLIPGLFLMLVGLPATVLLALRPFEIGSVHFDVHTLLFAATAVILGYQAVAFSIFAKLTAITAGFHPANEKLERLLGKTSLEAGVIVGGVLVLLGVVGALVPTIRWSLSSFGPQDPFVTMRWIIPSALAVILGVQTVFAAFYFGLIQLLRRQYLPNVQPNPVVTAPASREAFAGGTQR